MVPVCPPRGPPPGSPPPAASLLDPPCRRSGSAPVAATSDSWAAATRCRRSGSIPDTHRSAHRSRMPVRTSRSGTRSGTFRPAPPCEIHRMILRATSASRRRTPHRRPPEEDVGRGRPHGVLPRVPASWRSLDRGAAIDMDGSLVGLHGGGPDRGYRRPPTCRLPRACPGRTTRPGTCSSSRLSARASRGRPLRPLAGLRLVVLVHGRLVHDDRVPARDRALVGGMLRERAGGGMDGGRTPKQAILCPAARRRRIASVDRRPVALQRPPALGDLDRQ